jgi:hypothetical protein
MAFRVIPVRRLKGPQFKVLFERFENGERIYTGVPKDAWGRHGFRLDMSLEEAKQQKDLLNIRERLSRAEARRQKCLARETKTREQQQAQLPEHFRAEFEAHKLTASKKGHIYWKLAASIIEAVALSPELWIDSTERFYKEFLKREMSPSYVKTVLPYINKWGAFYARKLGKPFDKVPSPPNNWAAILAEAHYSRDVRRGNRESEPLTPEMLAAKQTQFTVSELRWLKFTVWFGLRPIEADLLSKPTGKRTWWIGEAHGVPVLWIYQTKLRGLKPDKRSKGIPAIRPEQRQLLSEVLSVSRPKSMSAFKDVTLYGGRKGFIKLMKSFKQSFENISAWMGHTDIKRTYQSYFNKQDINFDPAA